MTEGIEPRLISGTLRSRASSDGAGERTRPDCSTPTAEQGAAKGAANRVVVGLTLGPVPYWLAYGRQTASSC